MGTSARVVLYSLTAEEANSAALAAFAEIAAVDVAMSDWSETSELSRLNQEGSLTVSPPLFDVIEASLRFARMTDGAFDPTVGPVTAIWRHGKVPSPEELREAGRHVDWRRVRIDAKTRMVSMDPGMALDLGGIAKGYAVERALRAIGNRPAMIELGGDLALGAPPPDAPGWRVALLDGRTLNLARCFVSTSGDVERGVDAEGIRYSHIVDPKTGMGLVGAPVVLVVASDGMTSDALSTAVSVRGPRLLGLFRDTGAVLVHPNGRVERIGDARRFRATR